MRSDSVYGYSHTEGLSYELISRRLYAQGESMSFNTIRNHAIAGMEKLAKEIAKLYPDYCDGDYKRVAADPRFQSMMQTMLTEMFDCEEP